MKTLLRMTLATLMAATAFSLATTEAQAQCGASYGHGFYGGYLSGGYVGIGIPHFAKHPPVYYSHPVARPYGWSPYAYPPGVQTPVPTVKPAAAMIVNPYVKPRAEANKPKAKTASDVSRPGPVMITNPFVVGDGTIAGSSGFSAKVIYPTRHQQ